MLKIFSLFVFLGALGFLKTGAWGQEGMVPSPTPQNRQLEGSFTVAYPKAVLPGRSYSVDVDFIGISNWTLEDEEEYPIYIHLSSQLFKSKTLDGGVLLLHKFGGTYGPARFLLEVPSWETLNAHFAAHGLGNGLAPTLNIVDSLTFFYINKYGFPIGSFSVDIAIKMKRAPQLPVVGTTLPPSSNDGANPNG